MAYRLRVLPKRKRRVVVASTGITDAPHNLRVVESCLPRPVMKDRLFCNLTKPVFGGLDAISSSVTYPKGAILFVEGQEPLGVFAICDGRVKLTAGSADGKSLILRIADPGEIVGLPGTISGKSYEATAEALEPVQANFIPRPAFLEYLREHSEAALQVAEILSDIYRAAYQEVRYLGLSGSAKERLARFLLDRITEQDPRHGRTPDLIRVTLAVTHEEIAQMIGASRETVTRVFAAFKRTHLVEMRGSTLIVPNKARLEKLLNA